ncbi:MAG: hypothetical protein AB7K71_28625 [Polyangiaceae bacterium]
MNDSTKTNTIIGGDTTYIGTEEADFIGQRVCVAWILRTSVVSSRELDFDNPEHLVDSDEHLAALGGAHPGDRAEIGIIDPTTKELTRTDVPVTDLECFAHLRS